MSDLVSRFMQKEKKNVCVWLCCWPTRDSLWVLWKLKERMTSESDVSRMVKGGMALCSKPFPRTQNGGGGKGQKTRSWIYLLTITVFLRGEHRALVKLNRINIPKFRAKKQGQVWRPTSKCPSEVGCDNDAVVSPLTPFLG